MDDKLIVSNRSALKAKYGAAGFAQVQTAVRVLMAADKKRGLRSRLVFLDDAAALKKVGGAPVTAASSARQAKLAIDALCRATDPDYLLILGAPDVVPQQDLANPVYKPQDDDDVIAWGDLPYACEAAYGRDIAAFKGPTRVVGRLPDLVGAGKPAYLLGLLRSAAAHQPRPLADYARYFGLSARVWQGSTALSLFNVFGDAKALTLSPPANVERANHPAARLAPLLHFINCHGGLADPKFYGQQGENFFPTALSSDGIAGLIQPGTVVSAECCYGTEMYDAGIVGLPLPISQRYLAEGACAFFGSSTIAYGPPDSNGAADLLAQYFLLAVLAGASTGRATLMARQRFVEQVGELDPFDLKTLAQFSLLGDPSAHPARLPTATEVPKGIAATDAERAQRRARRAKLRDAGHFLDATTPATALPQTGAVCSAAVKKALARIAESAGMPLGEAFATYAVHTPAAAATKTKAKTKADADRPTARAKAAADSTVRYHIALSTPQAAAGAAKGKGNRDRKADTASSGARFTAVAAVAREVDGRVVAYRIYAQH
jgi:hypothetical protein